MPRDLERVNRNLRRGAYLTLGVMALALGYFAVVLLVPAIRTGRAAQHPWLLVLALGVVGGMVGWHVRAAWRLLGTRLSPERLTWRAGGEDRSLPWSEVTRVQFDHRHIKLERRGAEPVYVSLLHANRPHEVREAICALVPVAALRGPDA
jgi:hypothetical protein